jgi:hypothetical protein
MQLDCDAPNAKVNLPSRGLWYIPHNICSDNLAMLEFRRNSNDLQTTFRAIVFTGCSVLFAVLLTGGIVYRNPSCAIIGFVCFSVTCFALVRCVRDLLIPFDHVCTFTPTCVHWATTNGVYPSGRIDSCTVRTVYVDLDDLGLSFDTGSLLARGIRAEIGLTTEKLRTICDYIVTHWSSVTVYCIERGVRRCVSCESGSQNHPMDRSGGAAAS